MCDQPLILPMPPSAPGRDKGDPNLAGGESTTSTSPQPVEDCAKRQDVHKVRLTTLH